MPLSGCPFICPPNARAQPSTRCLQGPLTDPSAINISSSWQRNKGRGRTQHHPAWSRGLCESPWRRGWRGPSAEGRAPTAGSAATSSAFCPPPAALGPASSRHRRLQTSSDGGVERSVRKPGTVSTRSPPKENSEGRSPGGRALASSSATLAPQPGRGGSPHTGASGGG